MGEGYGQDHYLVRSKLALLHKDLQGAEVELLNQGKVDECIEMYVIYVLLLLFFRRSTYIQIQTQLTTQPLNTPTPTNILPFPPTPL